MSTLSKYIMSRQFAATYLFGLMMLWLFSPYCRATTAADQTQLTLMIQQLNALEHTARDMNLKKYEPGKRYYFDYPRLTRDIERIRLGLENYLTPSRAQPRDPVELSGSYSTEGRKP